jgi:FAD/FMN-containing dehydrogenase/Fe-S oxidoreductase
VQTPASIEREIARRVRGRVRADEATRLLFSTDASNYRQVPLAVVEPEDEEDALSALAACRDLGLPVLPRGAGTSLAGQACNVAVVLDFTRRMRRVLAIDPEARLAVVEPGCVLDVLQLAARPHGLRFGPDPSSHDRCTLGGMIANDACGARSLAHGRTSASVVALRVALQDASVVEAGELGERGLEAWCAEASRRGDLGRALRAVRDEAAPLLRARLTARLPALSRQVSGYALDALLPESGVHLGRALCGTEGTCAVTLRATLRLVEIPRAAALLLLGFRDIVEAAESVPAILESGGPDLRALEAVESSLLRGLPASRRAELPEGEAWLYAEVAGATPGEARAKAESLAAAARRPSRIAVNTDQVRLLWAVREAGVGSTARLADGATTAPGWEDAAVPPARLPSYLRRFRALLERHGLRSALYGHFGEGCVHARITFALATPRGRATFREFLHAAADLVVEHGGSLSGEHGDGQARGALLERMYGPRLVASFRAFKDAWDPAGLLNPGKVVDARAPDDDLRAQTLAPALRDPLGGEALGCVGVGSCRRDEGGAMCPSFRATREEAHSPRGRARLLAEHAAGLARTSDVLEALHLCLGCKACASECPASVDVAGMKAELLSRLGGARVRERRLADVADALRIASRMPRLANALASSRVGRIAMELASGLSRDAPLPRVAARAFEPVDRPADVVLFVDTFTKRLEPGIAEAALRVVRRAGLTASAPDLPCCGRPLFEAGRLGEARELAQRLSAMLPRDATIVGLEPACVSMLRDDAPRRLGVELPSVLFFSEWAALHAERLPRIEATTQVHCHEQALSPARPPGALDAGCCGFAGNFGLAVSTRPTSLAVGELTFLPAVRALPAEALVVADGLSCRLRALEGAGRRALHLAQVLDEARW